MIKIEDGIAIKVETEGIEEATEKVSELSDVISGFPSQVVIRGAKNCTFKIYPSQVMNTGGKNDLD